MNRSATALATSIGLAALASCGGGGGDSGGANPGPSATFPASGIYALAVSAQGPTATPRFGVSLVHPSATDVEYVIEPSSSDVSDVVVVSSGSVDTARAKVDAIQPYAALYIVGGDVRRLPLAANGAAPLSRVRKAGSTGACKFVVQADDYAAPDRSRYIVSTAGADGVCGSADDGQAEVVLDSSGGLSYSAVSGAQRLGVVRDSATLAPRGWLAGDAAVYWSPFSATTPTRTALASVVVNSYRSAVVEAGGALSVIDFGLSNTLAETQLDPAVTAGTGWQSIGFDADNYYVYRNSGPTAGTSTWTVVRVSRAAPTATALASGTGLLSSAGIGTNLLYATESGVAANRVLTYSKTIAGVPHVLRTLATTLNASVLTSADGAHEIWTRPASGSIGDVIEIVDEAGLALLPAVQGGYALARPEPTALDFSTSENHTRFIFASGYGAAGFSGAALEMYDTTSGTHATFGTLPGASRYGSDPVFASVTDTALPFLAGYAARVVNGSLQASDAVAYTFDLQQPAASLKIASTKQ